MENDLSKARREKEMLEEKLKRVEKRKNKTVDYLTQVRQIKSQMKIEKAEED